MSFLARTTNDAFSRSNAIKTLEIVVATFHDVIGTSGDWQFVQNVHVVHFTHRNTDKMRNSRVNVEQCVNLNCRIARTKIGPIEHRQTKIDGRLIESENSVQFRFVPDCLTIKFLRFNDENISEFGKNSPVAFLTRVGKIFLPKFVFSDSAPGDFVTRLRFWPGQRGILDRTEIPRNRPNSHVIKFRFHGIQTTHYIALRPPFRELSEGHNAEVSVRFEPFLRKVTSVFIHDSLEPPPWNVFHNLGKNGIGVIHDLSPI